MKDVIINYKDLVDSLQPDKVISFEEKKRMIIEKYRRRKIGKNPEILRMMKNDN